MAQPNIVRRDKASSHPRQQGRFYNGIVTSVRADGQITVKIPLLNVSYGPVMPLNTTNTSRYSKDDIVLCGFTDENNSQIVVFGSLSTKYDVFTPTDYGISRYASTAARDADITSPSEGHVIYLLDSDELQIYNGTEWITVIDTGNSENITASTITATSASIGTLTVTGPSTLNVLGSTNLTASTTIGLVSPTELGYLNGVTSAIQTQINTKAPSASPTFTGVVTLPSSTSIGNVSSIELGYLDGVTSAIQTQIDLKSPLSSPTFTGTLTAPTINISTSATLPASTSIGLVSSTELGYLDGVTSAIQTQINTKAPSAGPTFTGTVILPSTTSIGDISSTEISYLDGVTSAIQTQLNTKAPSAGPTFTGTVTLPSTTSIGNVSSTEIGYLDGVTSAIQTQINGRLSTGGGTLSGRLTLNYGDPTIAFQDTDHRSGFLHCNSNLMYILRGGVNDTTWQTLANGQWPFVANLENGDCSSGRDFTAHGGRVYASSSHLGYWGSDGNWSGVQGSNGYLILNHPNTSNGIYLRTYTGTVHIGGSGYNTLAVTDVTYIGTFVNKTGIFCALADDMWFTDPQNGRVDIRNYANTDWGTSQGYYLYPSSVKFKKNITKVNNEKLFNDAINSGVYEFSYNEDTEEHNRVIGPILEDAPEYFKRKKMDDGLFISSYVGMLHGAIKHMAKRIDELEKTVGV